MVDEAKTILTEGEINKFLKKTLDTYLELKRQKRDRLAVEILKTGSVMAKTLMTLAGIKAKKVFCRNCGRQLRHGCDIEFHRQNGRCLHCDNLDVFSERR